jgi:hypothetical protein
MAANKKNQYLVSALLFVLIVLSTMNLLSCGGSDVAPVIYSISPNNSTVTAGTGASPTPSKVTLIGANFGTKQDALSHVFIDKVETGTAPTWTDTTIVANVIPFAGLSTGQPWPVNLYVSVNGQVSNAVTFTYIGS